MAKAAVVKERHSCSECACFEPYTDRQRLSMKGEVFWGWCPIKKTVGFIEGDCVCGHQENGRGIRPHPNDEVCLRFKDTVQK